MTSYPGNVDSFTTGGATDPTNNPSLPEWAEKISDAVVELQKKLGTGASTPVAGRIPVGQSGGGSLWQDFDPIPSGLIAIWSGTVANIPSGWVLCNGANGTPDLRDRFIAGAGSTYAVGATGGAANVALTTAQLPSHTHTGNSSSEGSHAHTSGNLAGGSHTHGSGNLAGGNHTHGSGNFVNNHTHASGNLTGGNHSHGVGTLTSGSTNLNHSHGISLRGTGSTNHAHDSLNVSAGAGFTNVGWNQNSSTTSGAANLNHNHTLSGATANAGVSVNGNTSGSNASATSGTSAASTVGVSGNTAGSAVGVSGNTSSTGAHSHTISIGSTGSGNAHENRPPYYALAFIMKL